MSRPPSNSTTESPRNATRTHTREASGHNKDCGRESCWNEWRKSLGGWRRQGMGEGDGEWEGITGSKCLPGEKQKDKDREQNETAETLPVDIPSRVRLIDLQIFKRSRQGSRDTCPPKMSGTGHAAHETPRRGSGVLETFDGCCHSRSVTRRSRLPRPQPPAGKA